MSKIYMLDIIARSQRGRICRYSHGKSYFTTPCLIRSTNEGCIWIEQVDHRRVMHFIDLDIPLDNDIMTTMSSGIHVDPILNDIVEVIRLPISGNLNVPDSVEAIIIPNAYELRRNPRCTIDTVIRIREIAGFSRIICMLGIGEPSTVAALAYMGVDLFDDSLLIAEGINCIRLIPEAEIYTGNNESQYNIRAMYGEINKIHTFIYADRLRELVDQRSISRPSSVALLRIYDDIGYKYAEETCSSTIHKFSCNTTQSLRRADIRLYRDRISHYIKPKNKKVLLLLPCSAKKPYHTSKTHKQFASVIHAGPYDTLIHEVIITSPLGIVPKELDIFYPANSYDIPVTGEWKCEEKRIIRDMIKMLISQDYEKIICHLGDEYSFINDIADMECTVIGDPISYASLQNLDKSLKRATKLMKPVDYMIDCNNTMRSILCFQFGIKCASLLMDGNTYVTGRFPYWKINKKGIEDHKEIQIGMMTPERGMISLTMDGAKILANNKLYCVEIADFTFHGDIFAVGVISADMRIHIGDEAVITCNGDVRGVGVAMMCGREMSDLSRGVAVKVRHRSR